jgi:hypothetical protein
MTVIIHKDLSYAVKGACFDVHNALGPLLPEPGISAIDPPPRRGVAAEKVCYDEGKTSS